MAVYIENKKIRFNYEILEELEAGIELLGHEVKVLKAKKGSLEGAHVTIRGNEAYLVNMQVPAYQAGNTGDDYDDRRPRRLLLKKKEIASLMGKEKQKGLTVVPVSVYSKKALIKVRLAVVRGKKKHDKREAIKKRDTERDIERSLGRKHKL